MTLDDFIAMDGHRFAVILAAVYQADPVAQSISQSPTKFSVNGVEYVILSIEPVQIRQLYDYVTAGGNVVEFGFVQGTGAVKLLTHKQATDLMAQIDETPE